jgi:hypothetical protein
MDVSCNSMTTIKHAIIFFVIGFVLSFILLFIFDAQVNFVLRIRVTFLLSAFNSAVCLAIGAGAFWISKAMKGKRNAAFIIVFCLALFCVIALSHRVIQEEDHKKRFANIESNHDVMKYFVNDNEDYIRIGFNRLESEFKNPNDFNLDAFSVRKVDTIINGIQDTVYNIYFDYFLGSDKTTKYFSKVSVLDRIPSLSLYNLNTESSEEYSVIKSEKAESEKEAAKSIKEAFRQMPDSTKQMIKKAFTE